jgi:hypothetical protein
VGGPSLLTASCFLFAVCCYTCACLLIHSASIHHLNLFQAALHLSAGQYATHRLLVLPPAADPHLLTSLPLSSPPHRLQDVPSAEKEGSWPKRPIVGSFPVEEKGGFVWLFFGSKSLPAEERPPIQTIPELDMPGWKAVYGEHLGHLHDPLSGVARQAVVSGSQRTVLVSHSQPAAVQPGHRVSSALANVLGLVSGKTYSPTVPPPPPPPRRRGGVRAPPLGRV